MEINSHQRIWRARWPSKKAPRRGWRSSSNGDEDKPGLLHTHRHTKAPKQQPISSEGRKPERDRRLVNTISFLVNATKTTLDGACESWSPSWGMTIMVMEIWSDSGEWRRRRSYRDGLRIYQAIFFQSQKNIYNFLSSLTIMSFFFLLFFLNLSSTLNLKDSQFELKFFF